MKNRILKREGVYRTLSLVSIVISVFIKDLNYKMSLLILGCLGLIIISCIKNEKITAIIYLCLTIAALIGYYTLKPQISL